MKKKLLLSLFTFCILSLQATEKIIERPGFIAWSSNSIEIDKIVVNDTATILFIDAFYTPNWWIKIAPDSYIRANGTEYPLRHAYGIDPGKETYMPESGTLSFQLIFPPIPQDTKEIDFQEGNAPDDFCIWGIRLDGKMPQITNLPIPEQTKKTVLPEPVFQYKEASLTVHVLGYKPEINMQTMIRVVNSLTDQTLEYQPELGSDGAFTVSIPLLYPTEVRLYSAYLHKGFYLVPGESLTLIVNLPEKTRLESRYHKDKPAMGEAYYVSGSLEGLNKEILQSNYRPLNLFASSREEHEEMMKTVSTMNAEEYLAYFRNRYKEKSNALDALEKSSEAYRTLILQDAEIQFIQALLSAKPMLEYAYRMANQLEQDAEIPEEAKPVFTKEYYSFLKEKLPQTKQLLYSSQLQSLTRSLPYYVYIPGVNEDRKEELPSLPEILGTDKGFIFDWLQVSKLAEPLTNMTPVTAEQLTEISRISPEIANYVKDINSQIEKTILENTRPSSYNLSEVNIEDIPENELFAALTYPHRGKVIFVDFWATWCGPCIQAMKSAEPVKDEFMEKEVVFLYLAGENSPKQKWEEMMPGIHGEHFRVTKKQWDYWMKNFNIQGIPAYMVIGKDGNPVQFQTGFMGADWMRNVLNTELEK